MILLFCISLIRVELVVNERKIGSIIHVEKGEGSSCSTPSVYIVTHLFRCNSQNILSQVIQCTIQVLCPW